MSNENIIQPTVKGLRSLGVNVKDEKEQPTENTREGNKPKTTSPFEQSDERIKRMAGENDRREAILKREEDLQVRKEMSGQTEAGQSTTPQYSEEEKASRKRIKAVADASGASWGKDYE